MMIWGSQYSLSIFKTMKNFSLLFLSLLLFSCSEKESKPATNRENVLENFSYSVDTVVVDPGDEIINLTRGVSLASLNESKTHYYLLDENIGQVKSTLQFDEQFENGGLH